MPDATVIIAAYAAEQTLERSVSSALAQTGVETEVIVIDDASPDGTFALAQALAEQDGRIKALSLPVNGGPGAARNAGIAAATGTWIAVLDSDDTMAPDRLERMIAFARSKGVDALLDNFQSVDNNGVPIGSSYLPEGGIDAAYSVGLRDYLRGNQAEIGQPSLGFLKPIVSRAFLERTGLRYDERLRNGEDFHLMLALLAAGGQLWILPEVGYRYTARRGSVSNRLNPDHVKALNAADRAFLSKHDFQLGPVGRELLQRRITRLADLATAERALGAMRDRQFGRSLAALVQRPRALGRLAIQLKQAAFRRLRS